MKKILIFCFTFFLLIGSSCVTANLLLEPHVGYNIYGNADYNTFKTNFNGTQFGARLGEQYLGFMGGLDFTYSLYTSKSTSLAGNSTANVSRNQYGIFAGYNMPMFLRCWLSYYLLDKSTGSTNSWNKGSAIEFGVGFTLLPFLSLNFEYRTSNYTSSNAGTFSPIFKSKEIVMGISAPITLP